MKKQNKKIILAGVPLFLLVFVFGVFAFSSINAPAIVSGNEVQYGSDVCISTTGSFEGRQTSAHTGEYELVQCESNLVTDAGLDAIRDQLSGEADFGQFDYIALCNATLACGIPAAGDTTLENEYVNAGLTRAVATYGQLGTGNWSMAKTFTASASALETNKTGLLNQSTAGTLLAENTFTLVTLQNLDQLTVNWTITVTNP